MMLRDEDISTAPPSSEGLSDDDQNGGDFPPPATLVAQLELAKIVSFISRDMYTVQRKRPNQSFLYSVHSIFTRLKRWNEDLPAELRMAASVGGSRAISSLHIGGAGQVDPGPLLTNFLILILCQKGQRKI